MNSSCLIIYTLVTIHFHPVLVDLFFVFFLLLCKQSMPQQQYTEKVLESDVLAQLIKFNRLS